MAIFGKNGLWAAGLSVAALWALYGRKNAGFKDADAVKVVKAAFRTKGQSVADARAAQLSGLSDKYKITPEFKAKFEKQTYVR